MASIFIFYIIVHVEEVDDLFTEDILILNTHAEVFVWVGQSVESQRKKAAFKIGQVLLNNLGFCRIFPFIMFSVMDFYFFPFAEIHRDGCIIRTIWFVFKCTTIYRLRRKWTMLLQNILFMEYGMAETTDLFCWFSINWKLHKSILAKLRRC